ncbi:hypothetical protein THAOC_26137 [Thalassiosira oceanica]|uniref:Uncharacterized protein n=1 Tax=Thalassiosira oceanica TaxID=159749 RepID=K0RMC6_THAOC|nr:hypothetical protein THAOC_26137 [Thalassiosira oceanica]|eukprot:EJK54260.1 hypothetical protein THAOC_26137 [Thalassiosira oceanica]
MSSTVAPPKPPASHLQLLLPHRQPPTASMVLGRANGRARAVERRRVGVAPCRFDARLAERKSSRYRSELADSNVGVEWSQNARKWMGYWAYTDFTPTIFYRAAAPAAWR